MHSRSLPSLLAAAFLAATAAVAPAQAHDTVITISGVVHDSVARRPLSGATVQLIAADTARYAARTVTSDAEGRYAIHDVGAGRYTIGFFHPMLDSLGLEPTLRQVVVESRDLEVDLGIPSPARIAATVCGPREYGAGAMILGIVRDARDRQPVARIPVTVEWLQYTFMKNNIALDRPSMTDTTHENGWYAICGVPSPGRMMLVAGGSADTTDRFEVEMGSDGFLRRDLYVGAARDSGQRVSGVVTAISGGRPLKDALVSVAGGTSTRTDESGAWSLRAPAGTRVLEVHAIGFYPEREAIDVVPGLAPVRVSLFTMRAMLDTIHVIATRLTPAMKAFEERRRGGMGTFLDANYIARRNAFFSSQVFRMVPGVMVTESQAGSDQRGGILVRSALGLCAPDFFVDGVFVGPLGNQELDAFVDPSEMAGVEIYRAPLVPGQFAGGMNSVQCGVIAVWTTPTLQRSRMSFKRRAAIGAVLMGIGFVMEKGVRNVMGH